MIIMQIKQSSQNIIVITLLQRDFKFLCFPSDSNRVVEEVFPVRKDKSTRIKMRCLFCSPNIAFKRLEHATQAFFNPLCKFCCYRRAFTSMPYDISLQYHVLLCLVCRVYFICASFYDFVQFKQRYNSQRKNKSRWQSSLNHR